MTELIDMDTNDAPDIDLVAAYELMATIREFEETALRKANEGVVHGSLHLSVGMEAIPTGVFAHFDQGDWFASTHRGHGHAIAAGIPLVDMFAELFGRQGAVSGGKAGSMHIGDMTRGSLGGTGIVGAGIHLASGAALTAKLRGESGVAIAFFGDGAANRGPFHEGLNLASLWKLPVVFVCENNAFGQWTRHEDASSVDTVAERASAYGMPGGRHNGNDVEVVWRSAGEAISRARSGKGPSLLEYETYRLRDHSGGVDQRSYRSRAELKERRQVEPLEVSKSKMLDAEICTSEELEQIVNRARERVSEAAAEAESRPPLEPMEAFTDVTSD